MAIVSVCVADDVVLLPSYFSFMDVMCDLSANIARGDPFVEVSGRCWVCCVRFIFIHVVVVVVVVACCCSGLCWFCCC